MSDNLDFIEMFKGLSSQEIKQLSSRIAAAVAKEYQEFKKGAAAMPADGVRRTQAQVDEALAWERRQYAQSPEGLAEAARLQAEAERAELEERRQLRQAQEAYQGLSDQERAAYDAANDPGKLIREYHAQARRQEEAEFAAQLEKEKDEAMQKWFTEHPGQTSTVQRTRALQEVNAHLEDKRRAWTADRETRELQAEKYDDERYRLVHSLGARGQLILKEMVEQRPGPAERIEAVRQEVGQQKAAARNAELYAALQQEIREKKAFGNPAWITNIQEKYHQMGLDRNYRPG